MKQVLLKIIAIVVGQITRNRVLRDMTGFRGAPRGEDGVRKFSLSCGVRRGWDKTKPFGVGAKTISFEPALPHSHPYL